MLSFFKLSVTDEHKYFYCGVIESATYLVSVNLFNSRKIPPSQDLDLSSGCAFHFCHVLVTLGNL